LLLKKTPWKPSFSKKNWHFRFKIEYCMNTIEIKRLCRMLEVKKSRGMGNTASLTPPSRVRPCVGIKYKKFWFLLPLLSDKYIRTLWSTTSAHGFHWILDEPGLGKKIIWFILSNSLLFYAFTMSVYIIQAR